MVVVGQQSALQTGNPQGLQLPIGRFPTPRAYVVPAVHQHLLDACHVEIVLLAGGPVAPAPPFPPAAVAGGGDFAAEGELHLPVVQHHRELRAAGVEVEPARAAVVHEPRHVLLARVAEPRHVSWWAGHELEGAPGVERVGYCLGGYAAVHVQVVVAHRALVPRPYPHFLAPVALEWELRVIEFQPVLRVAEVGDLAEFHISFFFTFFASKYVYIKAILDFTNYPIDIEALLLY